MAILQELQLQKHTIYLGSLHLFGRNPSQVDTVLNNPDASQIHASIRWNNTQWEIVDHSRYGTMVDNQHLAHNKIPLAIGQIIHFAPNAQQRFFVSALNAPCPMLLPLTSDDKPVMLHKLHFLPNEMTPEISIHLANDGQWRWEDVNGSKVLHDGDKVHALGETWKFFNKLTVDITSDINACSHPTPPDTLFNFMVSQNEEHVQLAIASGEKRINLGERSHHYSLLTLARKRFSDASRGFDVLSQGWISMEQCSTMLGIEPKHLNMQLHRARQQLAQAFSMDTLFSHCIERRRGELRFGSFRFQIMQGSRLEAYYDPTKSDYNLPLTVN
jgi:hypothetical protein